MKKIINDIFSYIKRHRLFTRVISMLLAIVMVFYVIPSVIYAEVAEAIDGIVASSENGSSDANTNTTNTVNEYEGVLYEVMDMRERA